ncbi:DUF732 domain-containing protein [Mycobacterium sp. 852002-50816_SCH5313054-b]|uniref:DUF732 domain-containing protein n=1 Tax=Mycobacterium sp. 852002-50816_SCH5313054-b TaxID=1834092 RepID=UPI0009ED82B1|nr:DUF732 domain-containing protein [Mycobacterium sp. 852002-50816_SCH5313054-b]
MTVEGRDVPTGSVPRHVPRPVRRRQTPAGVLVAAAAFAAAALAGLISVGVYLSRDKTATSPGPQTVTISASSAAISPADGADAQFLSMLDSYGIKDNGKAAIRQRFMELGHHTCFLLLPPRPQSLELTVNNILSAQDQDTSAGNRWPKRFTHDDAEHLAQSAVAAYCPSAQK